MNRRTAIQNIALTAAGLAFLPACKLEQIPVFENIPLEPAQYHMLGDVIKTILPLKETPIKTPETTTDFILTMFNDCYAPEETERFLTGLKTFEKHLQEQKQTTFKKLDDTQRVALLTELTEEKEGEEKDENMGAMRHFIGTTRGMAIWHFTSSEHYMENFLDFEFVPGRYIGCEAI